MKRLVIFLGSQGHGSGAERVLEYLLAGTVDRREEICLLSPASSSVTTVARDLGYTWIPWISDNDGIKKNVQAYRHLIRHEGRIPLGSLVHAWHTRHLEWAYLLGRRWQVPSSGTLHDDPSPAHTQFGWLRKKIIRAAATRLNGVAAVSDAVARRCAELGWTRSVDTIRNGLPEALPVIREPSSSLRLGFLATGMRWKGITLLPELIRRTEDLPLQWNLFGSRYETGHELDKLITLPRVCYFGHTPLEEALPHIDVLLHLSLNLDPYPTVLLEAARAGVPVIASSAGGAPEIVDDGRTGILTPPGDLDAIEAAIRQIFGNPKLGDSMSQAAAARFHAHFRVDRMVADYFTFWDRLRASRS